MCVHDVCVCGCVCVSVYACVSPVDENSHSDNDDEDEADHYGNHLMHSHCTWTPEFMVKLDSVCVCVYV